MDFTKLSKVTDSIEDVVSSQLEFNLFPENLKNVEYSEELKDIWEEVIREKRKGGMVDMNSVKREFKKRQTKLASDKTNLMLHRKVKDSIVYKLTDAKGDEHDDVAAQLKRSKSISTEMKELIMPFMTHESEYKVGRVLNLSIPDNLKSRFDGCSLGADDKGFFVYTHRARSRSYTTPAKIPAEKAKKIEMTG